MDYYSFQSIIRQEFLNESSIACEKKYRECGKEDGALPEVLNLEFSDLVEIFSKLS